MTLFHGSFVDVKLSESSFCSCLSQKSYETKQYKKGLKAADSILKKFPEHGGMLKDILFCNYSSPSYNISFSLYLVPYRNTVNEGFDAKLHGPEI